MAFSSNAEGWKQYEKYFNPEILSFKWIPIYAETYQFLNRRWPFRSEA